MLSAKPEHCQSAEQLAEKIITRTGPNIVLALPLGLGKGVLIANALYEKAKEDSTLSLTILTALTLERPAYKNLLEERFLSPVLDRLFGDYPELLYARDRKSGNLPGNVRVEEFFFLAGSQLRNPQAQQDYICANYTHALSYILDRGVNVLAQLVSPGNKKDPETLSLSCNADLSSDLLNARREGSIQFIAVGEVNHHLPFFGGEAEVSATEFDLLLNSKDTSYSLFAPPKEPVSHNDYAAAMHIARLIADNGTLQIGIGGVGDALVHCLILRHKQNPLFREIAQQFDHLFSPLPEDHVDAFSQGLHGVSEMLVDGFLHLIDAGVLKREVDGKVLYGSFFLGPSNFYQQLRDLDNQGREKIAMCSIMFTNALYGNETFKRAQRRKARFVNKAMMATLLGEAISDGLEDGRAVSGVGGQHDFVSQAFALDGARSIITLPATRTQNGKLHSNILWNYGGTTIPRHLRDIIVTEYGAADLRGKTDSQVIAAMLNITDSRFQPPLLAKAVEAGKLASDYKIPTPYQNNYPEKIDEIFQGKLAKDAFPIFPLGSDFTADEIKILRALNTVKKNHHSKLRLTMLALQGVFTSHREDHKPLLRRMQLAEPQNIQERVYGWLLKGALVKAAP